MKRVTIIAGHYGSGKTNLAVNLALKMKKDGIKTVIADLDIVNPYFRTKDSIERLNEAGIKLISSEYANTNVDMPALPPEMYSIIDDKTNYYVVDLGGDDRGAYALGRFSESIKEENDFDFFFVFNKFRPLTPDAYAAFEVMKEIEIASNMYFTGIINNSNIGELTDENAVLQSIPECEKLSLLSSLPVVFTSVEKKLIHTLSEKTDNLFSLELQKKII